MGEYVGKSYYVAQLLAGAQRIDFEVISRWVPENSHVLDLGCADGNLLVKLTQDKKITGYGVELDDDNVRICVQKGLQVLQQDLEKGLTFFEDGSFDVAILSLTLQAVHKTEAMLREITRVGKIAIVSVPNFGYWPHRLAVLKGRMPVSKTLPYQWYSTPNVRVLTMKDFVKLAEDLNYRILERVAITDEKEIRFLPNLRGSLALFSLERIK